MKLTKYQPPRIQIICLDCGARTAVRITADTCPKCGAASLELAPDPPRPQYVAPPLEVTS